MLCLPAHKKDVQWYLKNKLTADVLITISDVTQKLRPGGSMSELTDDQLAQMSTLTGVEVDDLKTLSLYREAQMNYVKSQLSPEEKLLKAIFGEKASDIKDTSLRVPSSVTGTVIDVQIFTRDGADKNPRAKSNESLMNSEFGKDLDDEMRIVTNSLRNTFIQALKKENLVSVIIFKCFLEVKIIFHDHSQ